MILHPLHLKMTSESLEAFLLEPPGIDVFFFLAALPEDSANLQSEGSNNSLAKKTAEVKPHVLSIPIGITHSQPDKNADPPPA